MTRYDVALAILCVLLSVRQIYVYGWIGVGAIAFALALTMAYVAVQLARGRYR